MAQTATSALETFFGWWRSELQDALPTLFSRASTKSVNRIGLAPGGGYRLAQGDGDADFVARALSAGKRDSGVNVLTLPAGSVLLRTIDIPVQASARLRQILALELERATPFSADEATFDFVVENESTNASRRVRQVIVKNEIVEGLVADLRRAGVELDRVDAEGVWGINLLPASLRRKKSFRFRAEYALLAVSFIAACAAFYLRQDRMIDALEARRTALETETSAVRTAAAEANAAAANIDAARRHQADYPVVLSTLAALTDALGDDVWLTELTIAGRDVTLSGSASSSSRAISDLESSPMLEQASFTTAVFTDQTTKLERFSAKSRVVVGAEDPHGQSARGVE
jgi:general secretion pathway protein L